MRADGSNNARFTFENAADLLGLLPEVEHGGHDEVDLSFHASGREWRGWNARRSSSARFAERFLLIQ